MRDNIRKMNNYIRRYQRQGIEDSALAELNQRLDFLYSDYFGTNRTKLPQFRKNEEEFNNKLEQIADDFINNENKLIDIFRDRHKDSRYNTFKQNHPNTSSKQDYIDFIESNREYLTYTSNSVEFDSHQIYEFYKIGRERNLTTVQINNTIEFTILENEGKGMTVDILALNIRKNLRKL